MPAVDYRHPGGVTPDELVVLLRVALASLRLAGLSIAIYNPALDADGRAAQILVDCIAEGLSEAS